MSMIYSPQATELDWVEKFFQSLSAKFAMEEVLNVPRVAPATEG
jgi:hypothetical protein